MKPLVLSLKHEPDQRLDLSPLVPHLLEGKSQADIGGIELQTTRERIALGDLFKIRLGSAESIRIEGGSERLDHVGRELKSGEILVEGDVGKAAGRGMSGGSLIIAGNAGPYAGSGLSGGRFEISGNAGDFLGAPHEGEMEGLTGGLLIVRGNAGARAGDRLRRGTIVIEGSAGDHPGSRMIAGTLIILKACGAAPGTLMRRGTLLLGKPPELSPTFIDCGVHELAFARLFSNLLKHESRGASRLFLRPLARFGGDQAALGKGEIFFPA